MEFQRKDKNSSRGIVGLPEHRGGPSRNNQDPSVSDKTLLGGSTHLPYPSDTGNHRSITLSARSPNAFKGKNLQAQYERWQPRAKYRVLLDPIVDHVRKVCVNLRRTVKVWPPSSRFY